MPTYEYSCDHCGHKLEILQKITDPSLNTCHSCGQDTLRRGPGGGIGLVFKGSGFYITDYKKSAPSPKKQEEKESV